MSHGSNKRFFPYDKPRLPKCSRKGFPMPEDEETTAPAVVHTHDYSIIVNGREKKVEFNVLDYQQVVALAFDPVPTDKDFDVRFHDAEPPKTHGSLLPGESVTIKNGTKFDVTATIAS